MTVFVHMSVLRNMVRELADYQVQLEKNSLTVAALSKPCYHENCCWMYLFARYIPPPECMPKHGCILGVGGGFTGNQPSTLLFLSFTEDLSVLGFS